MMVHFYVLIKVERGLTVKKLLSFILSIFLIVILSESVSATSSTTYQIPDAKFRLDIPMDYYVVTKDSASSELITEFGYTQDDFQGMLESANCSLYAFNKDFDKELVITLSKEENSNDFNTVNDTALKMLASASKDTFSEEGITVTGTSLYKHSQTKFLKYTLKIPYDSGFIPAIQYYTIYRNHGVSIACRFYTGSFSSEDEQMFQNIIDSIYFQEAPILTPAPHHTDSFIYSDSVSGATFTVPENWTQESLSKPRKILRTRFVSNEDEGFLFFFGSYDLWSSIPASERGSISRDSLDFSDLSPEDIEELPGGKEIFNQSVYINGRRFYKYLSTEKNDTYDFEVSMTNYVCIENGYLITFQTNVPSSSPFFKDIKSVLSSLNIPNSSVQSLWSTFGANLLLGAFVTFLIHLLPILIMRYAIFTKPIAKQRAARIIVVDAIIVFVVCLILNAFGILEKASLSPIIVWANVGFFILTKGYNEQSQEPKPSSLSHSEPTQSQSESIQTQAELAQSQPEPPQTQLTPAQPHLEISQSESQSVQPRDEINFCWKCGAKIPQESNFCPKCGNKLQ